jgi:PhzF family phenazine biosynthesis protein
MTVPILQVDAFTDRAFGGNPAAVCLLSQPAEVTWMQHVAGEMNLAETAFVHPRDDGFGLRWFTPTVEVDLCGHATLASAHALWEHGTLDLRAVARFHTKSGVLTAERRGDLIELDFPATPAEPVAIPSGLADMLGAAPRYVGRSKFDYLVELDTEDTVRSLRPDFSRLRRLDARGIIVTSRAGQSACDFVSRFFAPAAGIDEDPVTGSAHCCLAPFWSARLHKTECVAHQVSARGGVLHVRLAGGRVKIGGHAITVLRGELLA